MENTIESKEKSPSVAIMASYGLGKFLAEFFIGAFGAMVYKFYETNVILAPILVTVGTILYSIWNAINDPLIGHFTQKPTPFSKKWGRRFPWIMIGSSLWVFTLVLIFLVPRTWMIYESTKNTVLIFIWMLVSMCLFDFLYSIWDVSYQSLFPDKFRSSEIRAKAAGIGTLIGVLGVAAGFLLQSIIIGDDYHISALYVKSGWIYAIVGIIFVALMVPGVKETPMMIKRYNERVAEVSDLNFFSQLKKVFKERNFVAFILYYFLYQAAMMSMTASVSYVGDYIIDGPTTNIFAAMLVGAIISVPGWLYLRKKLEDNQKLLLIAGIAIAVFTFPMTFINSEIGFIIALFIWGTGFGGFWMMIGPALADVIDEVVVKHKKRDDGLFMGFRAFFGRLSYAVQAISFWIIHELTDFQSPDYFGQEVTQPDSAKFGIHLHMATLPTIFIIIGIFIFWKMNTLNKQKVLANKEKLQELNL